MIKRFLKHKTLVILAFVSVMVLGITVNKTLAYFTAYTDAWGSKTLSLSRTTELKEDLEDNNKVIVIQNTSEDVDIYTRVKVYFANDPDLSVSVKDMSENNLWNYHEDDGYYYYTKALAPEESTEVLKAEVKAKLEEGKKNNLEVIVVHEYVTALYNEDGTGNMELSWEYGLDEGGNS